MDNDTRGGNRPLTFPASYEEMRKLGLDPETGEPTSGDIISRIADVILDNYEDAAACSHRPDNVRALFVDANARFYIATKIAEALTT